MILARVQTTCFVLLLFFFSQEAAVDAAMFFPQISAVIWSFAKRAERRERAFETRRFVMLVQVTL